MFHVLEVVQNFSYIKFEILTGNDNVITSTLAKFFYFFQTIVYYIMSNISDNSPIVIIRYVTRLSNQYYIILQGTYPLIW